MTNPLKSWRLRTWLIVGSGAALILACAALYLLLRPKRPARTEFPDYSSVLQYYPGGILLAQPTAKELRDFPALWPTLPPAQNASTHYLKAASLLSKLSPPPGAAASEKPYAGDLDALEKWVAANRPALDALLEGNKLAYCRYPFFGKNVFGAWDIAGMNTMMEIRLLARACRDAGIVEELKGNPDAAADWYLACIRMGSHVRHGPLIQTLVGIAVCRIGQNGLDSLITNANPSPDTLARAIVACRAAESSAAELADMFDCECEDSREIVRSQGVSGKVSYIILGAGRSQNKAKSDVEKPLYMLLAEPDAQATLNGTKARFTGQLDSVLLRSRLNMEQTDVSLRATQVRAAIALHQRENGKLPDTLDALCPKFLPSVPLDPFSGKPLRYERTEDGWKLWSVGDDLKDDGGIAKSARSWTDGPDYVFTSKVQTNLERIMQAK